MHKKRLLKLAGLLEANAKNKNGARFDLGEWGSVERGDDATVSCNTTACAAGLAAISGAFKRQGLSYIFVPYRHGHGGKIEITLNGKCEPEGYLNGSFANARDFFGLTNTEAEWLFIDRYYGDLETTGSRGERNVAKRIRSFIAGKSAPAHVSKHDEPMWQPQ